MLLPFGMDYPENGQLSTTDIFTDALYRENGRKTGRNIATTEI